MRMAGPALLALQTRGSARRDKRTLNTRLLGRGREKDVTVLLQVQRAMPSEPATAARQRAKLSIATLGAGLGTLPVPAPSSPRKLGPSRSVPTSPRSSPAGLRPTRAVVGARLAPVEPDFAPPPPVGHSRAAAQLTKMSLPPLAQRVPAIGGAVRSPRGSPRRTPRGSPRRAARGAPAALRKPAAPSPGCARSTSARRAGGSSRSSSAAAADGGRRRQALRRARLWDGRPRRRRRRRQQRRRWRQQQR